MDTKSYSCIQISGENKDDPKMKAIVDIALA